MVKSLITFILAMTFAPALAGAGFPCPGVMDGIDSRSLADTTDGGSVHGMTANFSFEATAGTATNHSVTEWNTYGREMAGNGPAVATSTVTRGDFTNTAAWRITSAGLPLVAAGLGSMSLGEDFRGLRNTFIPDFHVKVDDYLRFAPAAVLLGMKAFGVESRSSWGRMAASDAFSAILMAGVVEGLKNVTHVGRPDGSDNKSFPSGHTAVAFMTATMLTKEYGHLSPWVGIGANTVAAASGLARVANDKHWLSDVLVGAGIGIITTELGYCLADLVFKDSKSEGMEKLSKEDKPSFMSLCLGLHSPLEANVPGSASIGLEGAWFINTYFGLGAQARATERHLDGDEASSKMTSVSAGAYASYPLASRLLIGGKVLGGIGAKSQSAFLATAGLSLTFRTTSHYALKLNCDYEITAPSGGRKSCSHGLYPGLAFAITL